MGAANAIGTGAVVLTANADQLLTGLNKAQRATEKWAGATTKKANKAADAAGGGGQGRGCSAPCWAARRSAAWRAWRPAPRWAG